MIKVTEIRGNPHCFNLKDGTALRVKPLQVTTIEDSQLSEELIIAKSMGLIALSTSEESVEGSDVTPKKKRSYIKRAP